MDKLSRLNDTLEQSVPAAWACLSSLGRAACYPEGIPAQSAEARGCSLNATVGEVTDGRGNPLALHALRRHVTGLDPAKAFLYGPQGGDRDLRHAWNRWIGREGGDTPRSLPLVTVGLTHALSLASELFVEPGTDVLVPDPCWGNYLHLFGLRRGAKVGRYRVFDEQGGFDVASLEHALADRAGRPTTVVLNLPGNPTGYSPTLAEAARIVDVLVAAEGPLVVLLDDAYHTMIYEDGVLRDSLFWELVRRGNPARLLPVKIDGATKELFFFGGRVGFLTVGCDGAAANALEDKARCLVRASVSAMPGPSAAMLLGALQDATLEGQIAGVHAELAARFRVLRASLEQVRSERLRPYPANGGCFMLVGLPDDLSAHDVRRRLIREHSTGLVAIPPINALRIAFCSLSARDIPELVARLAAVVR